MKIKNKAKDKSISFPKQILDALEEYKKKTGISASDYIRNATCRKMIEEGIIKIKKITVEIKDKEVI